MALSKIKLLCMECGLRQWDIARQLGFSEIYVSKIEIGRVRPDSQILEKIAAILKVPVECILGD